MKERGVGRAGEKQETLGNVNALTLRCGNEGCKGERKVWLCYGWLLIFLS